MQWLTAGVSFYDAGNSRKMEHHKKKRDMQVFWSYCVECVVQCVINVGTIFSHNKLLA